MSLYRLERNGETDELVEVLRGSDDATIRTRAAEILGDLAESRRPADPDDDGDAEEDGGRAADDRGDTAAPGEREPLADADEHVVQALVDVADGDPDEAVRAAAIDALDRYGQAAIERLVVRLGGRKRETATGGVPVGAFEDALDAEQPELRMAAATAVGRLGDSTVVPALVERLGDSDARVRQRAAMACGRVGDSRAVDPLERLLEDPSLDVRRVAADSLGVIGGDRALSMLLESADADDPSIRLVVVDALGHFEGSEPIDVLVAALEDDEETIRETAMYSLAEVLSNAPPERGHDLRSVAAEALRTAPPEEVVPPLVEILTESTSTVRRRNAAWLLGRVGSESHCKQTREALVGALDDRDAMTAQFASTGLVELGGEGLESRLLEVVDDGSVSTDAQSKALFVLGKVGGETARERLEAFVGGPDVDERLRKQAYAALSKLGGTDKGELR